MLEQAQTAMAATCCWLRVLALVALAARCMFAVGTPRGPAVRSQFRALLAPHNQATSHCWLTAALLMAAACMWWLVVANAGVGTLYCAVVLALAIAAASPFTQVHRPAVAAVAACWRKVAAAIKLVM